MCVSLDIDININFSSIRVSERVTNGQDPGPRNFPVVILLYYALSLSTYRMPNDTFWAFAS